MHAQAFSQSSYLVRLSQRMRRAHAGLDGERRSRHTAAILSFRRDGGFTGRRGEADLYYTGFAIRALHALDEIEKELAEGAIDYLRCQEPNSIIDELSLLNCFLLLEAAPPDTQDVSGFLERFRAEDGGYAKSVGGQWGSTYHTFLAALCYDLLGETVPDPARIAAFLKQRRRDDGGFGDSPAATRSNTNATAAGASAAMVLGLRDEDLTEKGKGYLLAMRHDTGGWMASRSVPLPDLLSTYTALVTLDSMKALDADALAGAAYFARSCEDERGGFRAGPWDDQVDVEYTYYGLGLLAAAMPRAGGRPSVPTS